MSTQERLPARRPPQPEGRPPAPLVADVVEAEYVEVRPRRLRDHLRLLTKYRWLLATACTVCVVASVLYLQVATPAYVASTRLLVTRESPIQLRLDQNVLRVEDGERDANGSSVFIATQVAALQSRDLADRVIRTQRLADNAAFVHPATGEGPLQLVGGRLLALLRPRGWGTASVPQSETEPQPSRVEPRLLDRYLGWLRVQDVKGTDLVQVGFATPNPELSAFLVAAHTQAYLEANEEARRATDVAAKGFLGTQLRESRTRVEQAEAALAAFASQHPDVAVNQENKTIPQRITDLGSLLTKAEGTRVALQTRFDFLTRPDANLLDQFLDRPAVQKLRLALLDLQSQRAALGTRLGPNHEQMVELQHATAQVEHDLKAALEQESGAVRARYQAAVAREGELRGKLAALEASATELQTLGARFDLLKNDVDSARALHDSLLKQQLDTGVNAQLAASNVRVVERPEIPAEPASPNRPLVLTLGMLLGAAAGVALAYGCEHFDRSIKSCDEIEALLQLPNLGTVVNFEAARRATRTRPPVTADRRGRDVVVLHEPASPVAEAFRSIRAAVLFSAAAAPPKVILLTSAGASEGKTVCSVNLAVSLAEGGARVLLVDADLRHPACHRALGADNALGLSSALAYGHALAGAIRPLHGSRIDFLPAGPAVRNPTALLGSSHLRDQLELLADRYDFIVLDAPPVLPVSDALVLAREADGVVLVVRGHDSPHELVRRARDQLLLANATLLGTIVNDVDPGWGDLYLYDRHYGTYPAAVDAVEAHA
jgi:capsular exopolysaccharide synthesis family protein